MKLVPGKEVHYIPLLKTNQNFMGEMMEETASCFLKKKEIASCGLWYCIYAIRAFLTDSFADLTIQTPSRNLQENFYKRTKGGAYVCT